MMDTAIRCSNRSSAAFGGVVVIPVETQVDVSSRQSADRESHILNPDVK